MSAPANPELTARELAVRWLTMIQHADFTDARVILDADVVSEWPQSRERVRGVENLIAIFANYPGGTVTTDVGRLHFTEPAHDSYLMTPVFTIVKAQGSGETASGSILTRYPDGSDWYIVLFVKARGGKIVYNEVYFAPIYDAPAWRAKWVERMDEP
jgi:hypothetical protein